jgi:tRNA (guanine-N(7)-)-methyltransferase subunit TRM82
LKQRTPSETSPPNQTTSRNQKIYSNRTGHLLHSTALTDEEEKKKSLIESGHVRCAAVDREFKYLITSGEDKILKVWELDGLKLLSERYVF